MQAKLVSNVMMPLVLLQLSVQLSLSNLNGCVMLHFSLYLGTVIPMVNKNKFICAYKQKGRNNGKSYYIVLVTS